MLSTLLKIERDDRTVMIYADRSRMSGHGAAAMTAKVTAALEGFEGFYFRPAHNHEMFGWSAEFETPEAAVDYLLLLLGQRRG